MSGGEENSSSPLHYVRGACAENTPCAERALLGRGLRKSALLSERVLSIAIESYGVQPTRLSDLINGFRES